MAATQLSIEVRRFLESMRVPCVISTLRPDGQPITSATWFGFLGEDIVVSTPAARNKARNVRHDPRISFIVDTKTMPYQGVAIEGHAELVEDPAGTILESIAARYVTPAELDAMRERLDSRGARVVMRIRCERVRPWSIPALTAPSAPARPPNPAANET